MSESPIKFVSVKCPECGAALSIENDRARAFCSYCGTKILIANENERIERKIDEAEIKKAEADRDVRLKELEAAEKKNKSDNRLVAGIFILLGLIVVICFIMMIIGSE